MKKIIITILNYIKNYKKEISFLKIFVLIILNLWLLVIFWKIILLNDLNVINTNSLFNKATALMSNFLNIIGLDILQPNTLKMLVVTATIVGVNLLVLYFSYIIILATLGVLFRYSYKAYTNYLINQENLSYFGFVPKLTFEKKLEILNNYISSNNLKIPAETKLEYINNILLLHDRSSVIDYITINVKEPKIHKIDTIEIINTSVTFDWNIWCKYIAIGVCIGGVIAAGIIGYNLLNTKTDLIIDSIIDTTTNLNNSNIVLNDKLDILNLKIENYINVNDTIVNNLVAINKDTNLKIDNVEDVLNNINKTTTSNIELLNNTMDKALHSVVDVNKGSINEFVGILDKIENHEQQVNIIGKISTTLNMLLDRTVLLEATIDSLKDSLSSDFFSFKSTNTIYTPRKDSE